jgi:MFS family permease
VSRVSEGDPARRPRLRPDLAPWRSSRGFRLLFASRTVTALGTQASEVALLVQAKQLTGSPLAVGLLGVVELVPLVVFGLYGGVLADRFDRRPLIRWCEAALGGCAVLLLVNALLPVPALWPLYAVTAVMMAADAGPAALRGITGGLRYAVRRQDLLGSYLADLAAMIFAYPNALFPFLAAELHARWATGRRCGTRRSLTSCAGGWPGWSC